MVHTASQAEHLGLGSLSRRLKEKVGTDKLKISRKKVRTYFSSYRCYSIPVFQNRDNLNLLLTVLKKTIIYIICFLSLPISLSSTMGANRYWF